MSNVRPLTLRKLSWMVDGKYRQEYDILVSQMIFLTQVFTGKFDPSTANPYRGMIKSIDKLSGEVKKDAQKVGMGLLGSYLKQIKRKKMST